MPAGTVTTTQLSFVGMRIGKFPARCRGDVHSRQLATVRVSRGLKCACGTQRSIMTGLVISAVDRNAAGLFHLMTKSAAGVFRATAGHRFVARLCMGQW